jgi:hypothetical protein
MKVNAFALVATTAPLFIAGAAQAGLVGLSVRLVDPDLATANAQTGAAYANGSWAMNGYVEPAMDTYRVYAQFSTADELLAVGDLLIGGSVFTLSTNDLTFFNAIGAFGNNGIQAPTDFTVIPGPMGYTSQWDSYIGINGLASVSLAPGLTAALGATAMGMGGLVGNTFMIDNTGWSTTPTGVDNTTFNAGTGFHEVQIMQLTVLEGNDVWGTNIVVTGSDQNYEGLFFHTPAPGALALLGLAGLAGSGRRRRQA